MIASLLQNNWFPGHEIYVKIWVSVSDYARLGGKMMFMTVTLLRKGFIIQMAKIALVEKANAEVKKFQFNGFSINILKWMNEWVYFLIMAIFGHD